MKKKAQDEDIKSQLDNIKELEERVVALTSGWQRTQADFLNYKKQAADERAKLIKIADEDLICELLPILDNFQLAAKHVPAELENDNWALGIKQIEKQLESTLFAEGLEKIESVGEEFDPALHEAIDHIESDQPENYIVEEILAGYKFDNTVLRPAKVKVSSGNFHSKRTK